MVISICFQTAVYSSTCLFERTRDVREFNDRAENQGRFYVHMGGHTHFMNGEDVCVAQEKVYKAGWRLKRLEKNDFHSKAMIQNDAWSGFDSQDGGVQQRRDRNWEATRPASVID